MSTWDKILIGMAIVVVVGIAFGMKEETATEREQRAFKQATRELLEDQIKCTERYLEWAKQDLCLRQQQELRHLREGKRRIYEKD